MQYDPIKRSLGDFFNRTPALRILFYKLLDLLLLRSWHIQKEIKKWANKTRECVHILDAGSGFGQYSYYMSSMNKCWNILGLDVKDEQISDCNVFFNKIGRQNVVFRKGDLTKYTNPNAFDLILCVDVMEHIEEDVQVFKNYYTSLKEGGVLLISTPSDQGGSDVHGDGESSFIEEHVRDGYNIFDIENKLREAGFTKMICRYSYGTPGKISWRLSMKYPILLLGFSKLFFVVIPFYYMLVYPFCFVLNWLDTVLKHSTGTGLIVRAWK